MEGARRGGCIASLAAEPELKVTSPLEGQGGFDVRLQVLLVVRRKETAGHAWPRVHLPAEPLAVDVPKVQVVARCLQMASALQPWHGNAQLESSLASKLAHL